MKEKTLILIHGFCENSRVWDALLSFLPEDLSVLAIDLPGYGSSSFDDTLSMDVFSDYLAGIIENLPEEKPVVVGHSMGGYVLLHCAKKYPELFGGLGLFHSSALEDSSEKKSNRLKTIEFLENHPSTEFFKIFLPGLVAPGKEKALFMKGVESMVCSTPMGTVIGSTLAMLERTDSSVFLRETDLPIFILGGKKDKIIPIETLRFQAALPQRCFYRELEESGHLGMMEQTEESANAILEFLNWVD